MNQEIPKTLRNALARQAAGDVHPSPDVLTAFMERALRPVENEVVTHHLARCADCREIVFLASEAAEEGVVEEKELVAAAARHGMAARPVYVAASAPAAVRGEIAAPKRSMRLRWLVPVVAVVLLVAGVVLVQLPRSNSRQEVASLSSASNRPVGANPEARQTAVAPNLPTTSAQPPPPQRLQLPHLTGQRLREAEESLQERASLIRRPINFPQRPRQNLRRKMRVHAQLLTLLQA